MDKEIDLVNCPAPCENHVGRICEKVVSCPNAIMPPFFQTREFILSLILIRLIYYFVCQKKQS